MLHYTGLLTKKPYLRALQRSLKPGGRLLFQMAGKGNAKDILSIIDELMWLMILGSSFSRNMTFPYGFHDEEEYRAFLREAGLFAEWVELFPKDMKFNNSEDLAGWHRTNGFRSLTGFQSILGQNSSMKLLPATLRHTHRIRKVLVYTLLCA